MMEHNIYAIVAADENNGIGKDGKLPWHIPNELKYFQDVTTKTEDPEKQNLIIMGRTTWESVPPPHRPLKDRKNVVLTRNPEYQADGAETFHDLDEAIHSADDSIESIYVIGGGQVFKMVFERSDLTGIFLTQIHQSHDCDTFLPEIPQRFGEPKNLGGEENDEVSYNYLYYGR